MIRTGKPPGSPTDLPKRTYLAFWFLLLTAFAVLPAYFWMFSGFSIWDDEGTLMLSVRQFLGGMKLYDQVPGYGPVYYFYNWILHAASGIPVTHDAVRMSSLIPGLLTVLVSAWIVLRLTRSLLLSSVTFLFTFLALWFFRNEPGHPQELCMLLMVCLVASGIFAATPRWRALAMAFIGAFTACLLLIKVNIGVFMMVAVALAILWHLPPTKFSRYLFSATAVAALILPFVLMKAHLDQPVAERYCLVVTLSTVSMLMTLRRSPRATCLALQDFWIACGSFFAVILVCLGILIEGQGISPYGILNSLVLANVRVSVTQGLWYVPVRLSWLWVPWILAGSGAAVVFVRSTAHTENTERSVCLLKSIVGPLSAAGLLFQQSLLPSVTPFSWLILAPSNTDALASQAFPRTLLCSVTVLQTLYAYPIAGSQIAFVQILLIVTVMVCLGDCLLWYRSRYQPAALSLGLRVVVPLLLLCVAAFFLVLAITLHKTYNSLPPLGFPGAEKIHLPEAQARDYHWLAGNLAANCDIFFGMPELPSLHIWNNSPPPGGLIADDWMVIYTDADQAAVSAALSMHPRACVFYNAQLVGFWNPSHKNMDALPLARYIHRNFKVVGNLDDFSFLVRKDRELSNIPSP